MRPLLFLFALALLPAANAQIATFSFAGASGDEPAARPRMQAAHVSASDLTRGAGVRPAPGRDAFAASGFTTREEADGEDYFELTLTPAKGFVLDVTDLVIDESRSRTGILQWEVRSSLDRFATAHARRAVPDDEERRVDQRVPFRDQLLGLSESVTIRLYGVGALAEEGVWQLHQVQVLGTVRTAPVAVAREPGWRLLSAPVTGLTVDDLAAINLVQGVEGQYPRAGANLFVEYTGARDNAYVSAQRADQPVEPGRGFFWYWYGEAFGPFDDGTSYSRDLRDFALSASGAAHEANTSQTFRRTENGFYMLGNPFAHPFDVACVSPERGEIQGSVVQLYDPVGRSYKPRFGDFREIVAPWQGFFVEVALDEGVDLTVNYKSYLDECVYPGGRVDLVGKTADASRVAFTLTGATADGETVRDEAAIVRFRDGASDGWDAHDASKLTPPAATHAMLAPVTTRDGAAYRTAISSLPAALDAPAVVPVSFLATDAGSYEIAWAAPLPAGWTAELRDLVTGTVTDLAASATYAFTSDATGWTPRFELVVTASGVVATESGDIAETSLSAARPNPTAGATAFTLTAGTAGRVTAVVLDALGRAVATVLDADLAAGATAEIAVDASSLAPGLYVLRVEGGSGMHTRRFVVTR
jgi:hypothetical protein